MSQAATIVPFPRARVRSEDQERLANALSGLQQALAEQQVAIAEWRRSIEELRTGVSTLHGSTLALHCGLDTVRSKVTALNRQAVRLQEWAETLTPQLSIEPAQKL